MATIADRIAAQQNNLTVLRVQQLQVDMGRATKARDWVSVSRIAMAIDGLAKAAMFPDDEDGK